MSNLLGIMVSFIFVILLIAVSTIMFSKGKLSNEGSRKFIHIGVSNWWIIAMLFFSDRIFACIVPAAFIMINYISYKKQIIRSMERDGKKSDLGTVYYAVSLFILSLVTFAKGSSPYIGALGILVMGYGDGFAAIIGKRYGKHTFKVFGNEKTIEGSISMFLISFIICFIISSIFNPSGALLKSVVLALVSAIIEAFSPCGFDNLTVPLICSYVYTLIK
jgi:phytol kinase